GAVAMVRVWCAADAAVVTRIGHGGVLYVKDKLTVNEIEWYGVAERDADDLLGWTQAAFWSPVSLDDAAPSLTLVINTHTQQMDVHEADQHLLSAPISTGGTLPPGSYSIAKRYPTFSATSDTHYHASWALTFGANLNLAGVYLHNHFGQPYPGTAVQVTPPLARWLYPRAAEVIIC
ncbi:MAG: L,D-transpeptidase, partial [Chloroflexota bacterium]